MIADGPSATARPLRVLLAGFQIASSPVLRRFIAKEGALCETARDGKDCLGLVRQSPPDVIFMEMGKTQVDCIEAVRFLRAEEQSRRIPIVVVADRAEEDARAEALAAGADELISMPFEEAEISARLRMVLRVGRLEREAELLRASLEEHRVTDPKTGALQRAYIDYRLDRECKSARRHGYPLSVMAIRLDRPFSADDGFDFAPYIRPAVDAVKNLVRDEDLVARYTHDELLVVMPHTDSYGSLILAERVRSSIEALPDTPRRVTASVGVASCQRAEDFLKETPLRRAHSAMKSAVSQGGNRVVKQD
ncbi:MAG: diguanylate cyclase [Acidobacteriota bacterium]